ncbi:MAG: enoyl-CoA hydratase/isomerase family protein [Actinobacteria bacterium]|nr:enoyl-CoA hydratase/isomerase family protein [Actinomycetota bacterium]
MAAWQLVHAYPTVNLLRAGAGAAIELNRPESLNAWNRQLGVDLRAAVECVAGDEDVRAVILRGAGRAFSSGADLREILNTTDQRRPDVYGILTELYNPIITGVRRMPKPVVAAVHGSAVGIGCSLALACDLIVAAESAFFMLAFVNIGLAPDGGASMFAAARVGATRAAEMAMLGERVPSTLALQWGLINRVFSDAEFTAESDALVERLAQGPTRSYAGTKRQLNCWLYDGFDDQLELEARLQREIAASDDFAEGVAAYLGKRQARYQGT